MLFEIGCFCYELRLRRARFPYGLPDLNFLSCIALGVDEQSPKPTVFARWTIMLWRVLGSFA